jgi:hypothetical protein
MSADPAPTVGALSGLLVARLHRLMPAGPRLDRLTADLADAFAGHREPIDAAGCRAVQAVANRHSRHLELHFDAAATARPDEEPRGWPPPEPAAVRRRAAGVTTVRRHDSTCVLTLDSLEPYGIARPYLDAAWTLAHGSERLVLDLRDNGGGDPATVAGIAGRLLGDEARHLSDVLYRDRRRQWWTTDLPAGSALTQPVTVLVGPRTYSSGEALAYHLQARGRVTVVGEPTRGAADHVTPVRLTRQVLGFLPEAEVRDAATGGNWEGTGVLPDVVHPHAGALEAALRTPVG